LGSGVADVKPGRVLHDRYRLDAHIAVGGMGEVWKGTDLVLDRTVAVKLLRPEHADDADLMTRFRAEARLAGLLSHPNIAQVYDFGETTEQDPAYLVMEFVDGPSLAGLLHDGPLDPSRTMDIVAQSARGLAAAHRAGLVHRDVKPGNLLLRGDGLVKVSDFGTARAESATPVTRTGLLPGTPGYMAPERGAGAVATPAADLYSLGVVAHQCLTGQVPFQGDALAVAIAHMERDLPPLPSSVPAPVAALVFDLTRKDPRARPPSADDVATRAERLRAALAESAQATPVLAQVLPTAPGLADPAPTRPDAQPADAPVAEAADTRRPGSGLVAQHLTDLRGIPGRLTGRLPGIGRISRVWARVALAVLAVAAIGAAGLAGWLLGARGSTPQARPSQGPPAASRPGRQAPGSPAAQTTAPDATPAASTSPKPSKPAATPSVTPSATPTASPTSSSSPTPQPTPSPTPTPTASSSPTSQARASS
jgi:eukaryotic-like serine/threonine-protein kinase